MNKDVFKLGMCLGLGMILGIQGGKFIAEKGVPFVINYAKDKLTKKVKKDDLEEVK
jgi:hypothetical protein